MQHPQYEWLYLHCCWHLYLHVFNNFPYLPTYLPTTYLPTYHFLDPVLISELGEHILHFLSWCYFHFRSYILKADILRLKFRLVMSWINWNSLLFCDKNDSASAQAQPSFTALVSTCRSGQGAFGAASSPTGNIWVKEQWHNWGLGFGFGCDHELAALRTH